VTPNDDGQRSPAGAAKRAVNFKSLARLTLEDPLTGLVNQLLLHDRLGQALTRSRRRGDRVAVFFIDLDGFGAVNEAHGFEVGNAVLCEVARRLGAMTRSEDTLSRVGGDEFVAVLSIEDNDEALATVTKRVESTFTEPVIVDGITVTMSASIGVVLGDGTETAEAMLTKADEKMTTVKEGQSPVR
jgi:diguanylate cyclase (GGDEF)-like protein